MNTADRSAADLAAAETTARILIETKSVLFSPEKPFTFTSGRLSPASPLRPRRERHAPCT